jgi:hypothetical protein
VLKNGGFGLKEENHEEVPFPGSGSGYDPVSGRSRRQREDFTDSSKINYKEAVDVVSACKIIDGYTDGSFNPTNTLTRGAAAKIICNMVLGPTTAAALGVSAAPFKDVPANQRLCGLHCLLRTAGHHQRLCRRHLPSRRHRHRLPVPEDAAGRSGL